MSIEEFVNLYVEENDIKFKKLESYIYTTENSDLLKEFSVDNPAKSLPVGYVIDEYVKSEHLKLVNLNTLTSVDFQKTIMNNIRQQCNDLK